MSLPPLSKSQLSRRVKDYAAIESRPGLFVLGCFARRVTLYSQQVRAFNLVYALQRTGKIDAKARVAVVGAGAAGLAAAGALSYLGCRVTVFEQTQGVLPLQTNAVTRYIHPRIYDWPDPECLDTQSRLPLFDWTAEKADRVVKQLSRNWDGTLKANKKIQAHFLATILELSHDRARRTHRIHWRKQGESPKSDSFDTVILALGFGVELEKTPSETYRKSYWSPDDLDDDFHDKRKGERWLISGAGDGALNDLMRICILNFRYENIVNLLEATNGIAGIKADLVHLHSQDIGPEELSREFYKLSTDLPSRGKLENKLLPLLRELGPDVFLTTQTPHLYGPGSSVLNRLIVLLLSRLGAFTWLPGPSDEPVQSGNCWRVGFHYPAAVEEFDRVILRHGTIPVIDDFIDRHVGVKPRKRLKDAWSRVKPERDRSRVPEWPAGFFGIQARPKTFPGKSNQAFDKAVQHFGLKIAQLSLFKELREDGSSTVTYAVEGLEAVKQPLKGVHICLESCVGKTSTPRLNPEAERLGLRWKPDKAPPDGTQTMEELRALVRTASGTVVFPEPLTPSDPPLTFYVTVKVLNGDALSQWEMAQFYSEEDQKHVDMQPFPFPLEYFARFVWCPVEILKVQITLPKPSLGPVVCHTFSLPKGSDIHADEVVQDSVLQLVPLKESPWHYEVGNWHKTREGAALTKKLDRASAQTWALTVKRPDVGSCYSLDWKLPGPIADLKIQAVRAEAAQVRNRLANYRGTMDGAKRVTGRLKVQLRRALTRLHADLDTLQRERSFDDQFSTELLIYDETTRRLQLLEEILKGDLAEKPTDLWFPFGLGLGGACFKQGDAPYFYYPDLADEEIGPEYYLLTRKTRRYRGMVSIPLLHPEWTELKPNQRLEPSQLCIGVVDLSFEVEPRWLTALRTPEDRDPEKLWDLCQVFSRQIFKVFGSA